MSNESVTLANNNHVPLTSDVSTRLLGPVEVASEIKQIETSAPLNSNSHGANHVNVPRIDRLIRKGHQPKD